MLKRLGQIELAVAGGILGLITVMVFVAAVMRFFGHPLIWSVDLAQLLFIWLCFLGATRALREKGHLGVDVLIRHLPYMGRLVVETAITVIVIVFLVVLAKEGADLTMLNRQRVYGDSGLSYGFVTIAVPVGCLLLSSSLIYNAIVAWTRRDGETLIYSRLDFGVPAKAGD
ncbi:TRAP transporter small permease [Pelagibacterium limicola]|uniref:TRAP transporter small permease n=1 Tax=Pelagibacterium limicola TaxID=2791022 RepID=UPI0018AFEE26|nr:TRAP transporter small permease subunit [Pelagibacterium limicola]